MTTTIEDRLQELLDAKDAELAAAQDEIRKLRYTVEIGGGWALPREVEDVANLPLPRLEFVWTPCKEDQWGSFRVEYRLVRRHLLRHTEVVPLGRTSIDGSRRPKPWRNPDGTVDLPIRDSAHACFDSAHLNLPVYAICPDGTELLRPEDIAKHHVTNGHNARRDAKV